MCWFSTYNGCIEVYVLVESSTHWQLKRIGELEEKCFWWQDRHIIGVEGVGFTAICLLSPKAVLFGRAVGVKLYQVFYVDATWIFFSGAPDSRAHCEEHGEAAGCPHYKQRKIVYKMVSLQLGNEWVHQKEYFPRWLCSNSPDYGEVLSVNNGNIHCRSYSPMTSSILTKFSLPPISVSSFPVAASASITDLFALNAMEVFQWMKY